LAEDAIFNGSRPMAIYFHGWKESLGSLDAFIIREAYEDINLDPFYNVITVDWSYYAPDEGDVDYVIPQLKIVSFPKVFKQIFF
jgi:hypothetical protein